MREGGGGEGGKGGEREREGIFRGSNKDMRGVCGIIRTTSPVMLDFTTWAMTSLFVKRTTRRWRGVLYLFLFCTTRARRALKFGRKARGKK